MSKPEIAYAMVAIFKKSERIHLSSIRHRRKDAIEYAKATFYGGGETWAYIKHHGWKCKKIKISKVSS